MSNALGRFCSWAHLALVEDRSSPGRRCVVHVPVDNVGDATAADVAAYLDPPRGLRSEAAQVLLGTLSPGARRVPSWTVEGERVQAGVLRLEVVAGTQTNTARLQLVPGLEIRSCGPASPVALRGEEIHLQCLLVNTGTVVVLEPVAHFSCGEEHAETRAERILPGQACLLRASFPARAETISLAASLGVSARNCTVPDATAASGVIVGAGGLMPASPGKLQARSGPEGAVLENEFIALVFRRNAFGFGLGELLAKTGKDRRRVAWLPGIARVDAVVASDGQPVFAPQPPEARNPPDGPARLCFRWSSPSGNYELTASFELAAGEKNIRTRYDLTPLRSGPLNYLEGPTLYVLDRDESLFPGVEWLVDEEVSSSALDIAPDHSDRIRYRVHPNWITIPAMSVHGSGGTVALLWNARQKWDGTRDRPGACFGSPDRVWHQRAHRLGLFVPSVPEYVRPNTWKVEQAQAYALEAGKPLRLEALIYVDAAAGDALAAVDEWIRHFGIPQPDSPPRGSYEREIEFAMRGYLESLWIPETKNWWTTKGGGSLSGQGRPPEFVADLLAGALLSPGEETRRRCQTRAEEVLALTGGEPRLDAQRFPTGFAPLANPAVAADLLRQRDADGAWAFDADQQGTGPFVGLDYHELGPDHAVESGTCARKAFEVLRYARITGDANTYAQMQSTLRLLESFRVPRAAQVWEVPVHVPDILAAADAVDAFVEAYRFNGETRWLTNAVAWARRGLPFVYLWSDPERPFLARREHPCFWGDVVSGVVVWTPGAVERSALRGGVAQAGRPRPEPTVAPGCRAAHSQRPPPAGHRGRERRPLAGQHWRHQGRQVPLDVCAAHDPAERLEVARA